MSSADFYVGSGIVPAAALWSDQKDLKSHLSPVTCLDIRGDITVTGGYDGHVIRWDPGLTEPMWSARFSDLVNGVSIAPGGADLAVAVADGHAYVLDLESGLTRRRLGPHGDDVNDIAWHPTAEGVLATVCDAKDSARVYLWALDGDNAPMTRLTDHEHGVFAVAYDPAGRFFATASEDATVRVWTAGRDPSVVKVLGHPGDVETLAWSRDGTQLATGCDDGVLRLWSARDWTTCQEFSEARASVRKVGFSPSNRLILGASYDGHVRVYDLADGTLKATCRTALQWERACALADDETLVIGSFGDRPHRVAIAGSRIGAGSSPVYPTWGINALATDGRGETYVGTDCGQVVQLTGGRLIHSTPTLICGVRAGRSGGRRVAIADYLGRLALSSDGAPATIVAEVTGGPLNSVEFTPHSTMATGGYDGMIRLWTSDGREIDRAAAHDGPIKSVAWCEGAQLLIAGSSDNTLSAWEVDGRLREICRYQAEDLVLVNSVAASAHGAWVAIASRDASVRLWHPLENRMSRLPAIHAKSVKAVAVSPGGDTVVSGSYDGTAILWYLDEETRLEGWRQTHLHGKPGISSVAAETDRILTTGWDGTVAEWSTAGTLLRHYVRVGGQPPTGELKPAPG